MTPAPSPAPSADDRELAPISDISNALHAKWCSDVPNDGTYTLHLNEVETIRFFEMADRLIAAHFAPLRAELERLKEAHEADEDAWFVLERLAAIAKFYGYTVEDGSVDERIKAVIDFMDADRKDQALKLTAARSRIAHLEAEVARKDGSLRKAQLGFGIIRKLYKSGHAAHMAKKANYSDMFSEMDATAESALEALSSEQQEGGK